MPTLRKAIFPVSGFGTRFLPATKALPKEMFPLIDKPLLQYAVEEAVQAGICELIFVTGRHRHPIEDHFIRNPELERKLAEQGKHALLHQVQHLIPPAVHCTFVRQPSPIGLGHAILCAEHVVGSEPFAVLLCDDLIDSDRPAIGQLIQAAQGHSAVATQTVTPDAARQYGIVQGHSLPDGRWRIESVIEKPEHPPSTQAVVGRYVFTPTLFQHLRHTTPGALQEIQLSDAMNTLCREEPLFGVTLQGVRYDCGHKAGFFQATVALGRKYHGFSTDA